MILRTCTLALLFLAAPVPAATVSLDAPLGGWRHSSGKNEDYSQPVRYPAVVASAREGQSQAALIAGRIAGLAKGPVPPAVLIVNGVAMPQRVEDGGHFRRPYAFNNGSNSVELRAAGGSRKVQFYEGDTGRSRPKLRVVLGWDSDGTDLDLHIISPDGQHVWYGNRVAQNGGALDVDVTTGYGPEIYATPAPQRGSYLAYVNYYGSGDNAQLLTVATLTIISNEGSASEKRESFRVPLRRAGELTLVKQFHY